MNFSRRRALVECTFHMPDGLDGHLLAAPVVLASGVLIHLLLMLATLHRNVTLS